MKAAVCYKPGEPLVIEDLEIDPPGPNEVKVKVAATAVCHTDIHVIRGELPFSFPVVVGHESAGYVDEVGEGVTSLVPGDRVVASLLISCGKCLPCRNGRPHLCEAEWARTIKPPYTNKKGEAVNQAFNIGSFAEYTVLHESQCAKIPADMPLDRASLLACGVITGFGAVVWRARPEVSSSCVVIGAGGVGLNSIQGAALCGAHPIIAVDINESKLEAAKVFGATHVINSNNEDPIAAVQARTGGRGADYVFVTAGSVQAVEQGVSMSGPRGMTVLVGLPKYGEKAAFAPNIFIRDERVLTGSYMGSTNLQQDIPRLVTLYQAGKLKLDQLITKRYMLEDINEAIDAVTKGKALRNIIMME